MYSVYIYMAPTMYVIHVYMYLHVQWYNAGTNKSNQIKSNQTLWNLPVYTCDRCGQCQNTPTDPSHRIHCHKLCLHSGILNNEVLPPSSKQRKGIIYTLFFSDDRKWRVCSQKPISPFLKILRYDLCHKVQNNTF